MGEQRDDPARRGGRDLARIALEAAREAARGREEGGRSLRRSRGPGSEGGRDPRSLGAVVRAVIGEQALSVAASERDVLDRWPRVAGELARHVRAVRFAADEGRLDLLPDSQAYAVQLRLTLDPLIRRVNDELDRTVVESIRVLTPVSGAPVASGGAAGARGTSGRAEPSAGYRRALAALQAGRRARDDPTRRPPDRASRPTTPEPAVDDHGSCRLPNSNHWWCSW
ncbi:DciA family protein (plasmid) [Streptomyces sp. QH1-20]|uniref:DciA family protein n=1 Tax=Streptomyces sp. QH1-20 TaxID=3240934 RepID=UPI00351694B9